jgi:hypothetical protein
MSIFKNHNVGPYNVSESYVNEHHTLPTATKRLLLLTGGGAGHMSHPFDDYSLTFGDMKEIVRRALAGELDMEGSVTEKTDGQNLLVSWKNGKVIAARNKSMIVNAGEKAPDLKGIATKFAGRGELTNAFVGAMKAMEGALSKINSAVREKMFKEGKAWMNIEIIWSGSANVIAYGSNFIIFHGLNEYNNDGDLIKSNQADAPKLAKIIQDIDQHIQGAFEIQADQVVTLPKVPDFAKQKAMFFKDIDNIRNVYKLKDTEEVSQYHIRKWQEVIIDAAADYGYDLPENVLDGLVQRWGFMNKDAMPLTNAKKLIDNPDFYKWVDKTDKTDLKRIFKDNIRPMEILFLKLGATILSNISSVLAVNPDETVRKMKADLDKTAADINASGNLDALAKLESELHRLQSIGGMDKIVPIEGIVFTYKGHLKKMTGSFAPINQILGVLKFAKK